MLMKPDMLRIIARIWDKNDGNFGHEYYTRGRLESIFEEFKGDSENLFAQVVDTLIKKFRSTPTVEQFAEVGREIRVRHREAQCVAEKKAQGGISEGFVKVTLKKRVEDLVADPSRVDELFDLINFVGRRDVERVLGRPLPKEYVR